MANVVSPLKIPAPILYAAEREAPLEGITVEEWIDRNFIYDPNAEAKSEAFWLERLARTRHISTSSLKLILDRVPNALPMPGDKLE